MNFWFAKMVLPEKGLLEKAAAIKRSEYSPLGKELKSQTSAPEKQYQVLVKIFQPDEKEEPLAIIREKLE